MGALEILLLALVGVVLVLQLLLLLRRPKIAEEQLVPLVDQLKRIEEQSRLLGEIGLNIRDVREVSREISKDLGEARGRINSFSELQQQSVEAMNLLQANLPLQIETGIRSITSTLQDLVVKQISPELTGMRRTLNDEAVNATTRFQSHTENLRGLFKSLEVGVSEFQNSFRAETVLNMQNGATALNAILVQLREDVIQHRNELTAATTSMRTEVSGALKSSGETVEKKMEGLRTTTETKLTEIINSTVEGAKALNETGQQTILTVNTQLNELKTTVDAALKSELSAIRTENSGKLEEMRKTVDEKLHATLEQRLGESFKQVSDRLEQVHRGLGEMQTLAAGVGDLKKVLTNVKTRGTWGEVQLGALLEQILTIDQYGKNIATKPDSSARVEFAIRLPGRDDNGDPVWLPIDAKFPMEDYQRLVEAQERGDLLAIEESGRALELRIKLEAKTIREKYIQPPHTTDFGILYLPTEGLYAEVLRRPGLADSLQRDFKITISGPTTLAAMLNSLQMGFRTLAIEKRSSEVWHVLGVVKSEFGKFGEALAHTKKKLDEASNSIDNAAKRNRVLTRKLEGVEAIAAPVDAPLFDESSLALASPEAE